MPATPRQLMVLRFWNRLDLAEKDKREVSEWIERQHWNAWEDEEGLRRYCAWQLFKMEKPEINEEAEEDPEQIGLGIGDLWLAEVKKIERVHGTADTLENLRYGELP